jgi:hypothetical protein
MAKDNAGNRPGRDPQPDVGDAELLFREEKPRPGHSAPKPPVSSSSPDDVFEVFELAPDPVETETPRKTPVAPMRSAPRVKEPRKVREPRPEPTLADSKENPAELVEEVWTRTREWGLTLLIVGGWVAFVGIIIYIALGQGSLGLALLALVLGGAIAVILAYPILITLERPVRITPEQAVRDYYGALSHHVPHFRRMWLLLSKAGRVSSAYGSFEGFKSYWKDRLAQFRKGHAGSITPLVFDVTDFSAEKSGGKTRIDADFTLSIAVRGQRNAGPIQKIPLKVALVRGPDKMWYLENGTLTGADRSARS